MKEPGPDPSVNRSMNCDELLSLVSEAQLSRSRRDFRHTNLAFGAQGVWIFTFRTILLRILFVIMLLLLVLLLLLLLLLLGCLDSELEAEE